MPINILQPQPNFNTLLAQALGRTFGNIGTGAAEGYGQAQENKGISALLEQYGIPPEQAKVISNSGLEAKDIISNNDKFKAEKSDEAKELTQGVLDEMASMLAQNKQGIGISPLTKIGVNRKGVENRNYFNAMRPRIEGQLLPLVNKGALSKPRFDFIMENIPKASDSQRAIRGKLKALSKEMGLNPKSIEAIDFGDTTDGRSTTKMPMSSFAKPPKGDVIMQTPDGNFIEVPRGQVKKLEKAGASLVR